MGGAIFGYDFPFHCELLIKTHFVGIYFMVIKWQIDYVLSIMSIKSEDAPCTVIASSVVHLKLNLSVEC